MSKNIIKDLLTLIMISFLAVKSLNVFFVETFIIFKTANIFLMLKETSERR